MRLTTFFVRCPPSLTPVRQTIFLVKCIEDSFWELQPPLIFLPGCRALVEHSEDQEIAVDLLHSIGVGRHTRSMALPRWMNVTLRLVSNVSAFLLNESSPVCPLAPVEQRQVYSVTESSATLIDSALGYVASSVGLNLPRTLAVVDGLSVATAFLLRLTESVPAEALLFLMVSGVVFWLTAVLLFAVGMVTIGGLLFTRLTRTTRQPVPPCPALPEAPVRPPPTLEAPAEQPALSDTARSLSSTIVPPRSSMRTRRRRH